MCQGTSTHINLTGDEIKARYLAMNAALLNVRSLIASANISKGAPKPFLAESLPSEDDDMGLIDWIQDLSAAGLKAAETIHCDTVGSQSSRLIRYNYIIPHGCHYEE